MFFPSTYPSSCKPWRNASVRVDSEDDERADRYPIRGTFFGCCASATAPHIANVIPMATIPTNFRFWILDFRLSDRELEDCIQILSCICFSLKSKIGNRKSKMSSYDPVRSCQHIRRNCHADLLRGFEIYHELELLRLLDGQFGGLRAFQDFVDICGGTVEQSGKAGAVGHKATGVNIFPQGVHRRQLVLGRERCDQFAIGEEQRVCKLE